MGQTEMTQEEIAAKASGLQKQARGLPDPSLSNYRQVLAVYKQILNDILVLIRELATKETPNG